MGKLQTQKTKKGDKLKSDQPPQSQREKADSVWMIPVRVIIVTFLILSPQTLVPQGSQSASPRFLGVLETQVQLRWHLLLLSDISSHWHHWANVMPGGGALIAYHVYSLHKNRPSHRGVPQVLTKKRVF